MQSMQMHRSEKIADAFICQNFTATNEKQHFLRKHKASNAQISTKLLFPRNEYEIFSQFYLKDCPPPPKKKKKTNKQTKKHALASTITVTFPPLIYTAMFQNLLLQ